jgi:hypothetical protein
MRSLTPKERQQNGRSVAPPRLRVRRAELHATGEGSVDRKLCDTDQSDDRRSHYGRACIRKAPRAWR